MIKLILTLCLLVAGARAKTVRFEKMLREAREYNSYSARQHADISAVRDIVGFENKKGITVAKIGFNICREKNRHFGPTAFDFIGSDDRQSWTTILPVDGVTWTDNDEFKSWDIKESRFKWFGIQVRAPKRTCIGQFKMWPSDPTGCGIKKPSEAALIAVKEAFGRVSAPDNNYRRSIILSKARRIYKEHGGTVRSLLMIPEIPLSSTNGGLSFSGHVECVSFQTYMVWFFQ